MSKENQDLLNLCRLNLMEDNIKESPTVDKDETMKAIDYKKRQIVTQLLSDPSPITETHIKK